MVAVPRERLSNRQDITSREFRMVLTLHTGAFFKLKALSGSMFWEMTLSQLSASILMDKNPTWPAEQI